ncbi:CDF family Co(II)/Ni(II) efflux transporter DmeF [Kordiimonas pumila]|uniref:CDF family Co(II)/Ni(II) efflux transporter DmeF n=1 Tax=Kordiimonas pumila TaxID=2161677 RepID=A0ABV7D2M5_9PROT|nr:CDF family Co(II)/Ni(II) efflux transporter DmeF [Kordiimonas pumila]
MNTSVSIKKWQHSHVFDEGNPLAERNTRWAVAITFITMIAEIAGGWAYNSMALLADGWHMSSHTLALGLSVLAYSAARHYANDIRFTFGTWKIEILGGYTSSIFLVGVAALMVFQSIDRLLSPSPIHYQQAIMLAILGLLVNLACAWLLKDDHHHGHDHSHSHHDLNLRSAYLHVITDAATSVLAIIALIGGMLWGANWLDPAMGILGACLVSLWAYGLLRDTSKVLLAAEMDMPLTTKVQQDIKSFPNILAITDLHIWQVGKGKYAAIISVVSNSPLTPDNVRQHLSRYPELVHITVEVNKPDIIHT